MAAGVMEIPHNVNDTLIRFRLLSALLDWGKVNLWMKLTFILQLHIDDQFIIRSQGQLSNADGMSSLWVC